MVEVSVRVRSGAARFDLAVQAESIRRAVSVVAGRYPKASVKVRFPIDSGRFFVEKNAARSGMVGVYKPIATAG